jgi:hypothetical protein
MCLAKAVIHKKKKGKRNVSIIETGRKGETRGIPYGTWYYPDPGIYECGNGCRY